MAANKEISISSDDLSKEGYSALAVKTPDNKLDASRLDTEAAREEAKKLAEALKDKKSTIQWVTADDLHALLQEAEASEGEEAESTWGTESKDDAAEKESKIPADIKSAADAARAQIRSTFGNVSDKDYASHLSTTRAMIVKWIPGLEVSSVEDISDSLYQSDAYINKLIDYLEQQSWDNTLSLAFGVTGSYNPINALGMLWGKITGEDEKKFAPWLYPSANIEFKTIEEKQEYIKAMLQKINAVMKWRKPGEWLSKETAQDVWWIAFVALGGYIGWKIAIGTFNAIMNKVTFWLWSKGTGGIIQGDPAAIEKAKKVGWIAKKVWWMRPWAEAKPAASPVWAPAASPSTTPSATPTAAFRELDVTKPIEKIVHEGVLRELYNQEVTSGTRAWPALGWSDSIPKNFVDEVKNGIDPAKTAEYQSRVARYLSLGNPPVGNASKLQVWQAELERAIRGEQDPSKWNLKAKAAIKTSVWANAAALSNRLAVAHAASQTETIRIGADEFKVDPRAKVPLQEIDNLQQLIAEQEAKKAELEAAKKKLEARILDEKKYTEARHTLSAIDWDIRAKELEVAAAKRASWAIHASHMTIANHTWGPNTLDTAALNNDPSYTNAEQLRVEREWELADLKQKKSEAKQLKSSLEGKYTNIDRWLVADTTGKLTDSKTMQKLNAPAGGADVWVKEKIKIANGEIVRLEWEISTRMSTLSGFIRGIPSAWNKLGVNIVMPDGTIERVTKIPDLFAKLVKASVKK